MMRRKKIIIGIHGVGNKPPQRLLQLWWQKAIQEGLDRGGYEVSHVPFELVYWAHFLYSQPQDIREKNVNSERHIDNPYKPAPVNLYDVRKHPVRRRMLDWLEVVMDKALMTQNHFFNFDRLGDYVIRKRFGDLELYYHQNPVGLEKAGIQARQRIRETLADTLRKHRRKDILLISHSMGTIIAYDVLTQLVPEIPVHTLVTLGSPLGLPTIMKKIYLEQKLDFRLEKQLSTPESIQFSWINASDLHDHIALNYSLSNDFKPNAKGIAPKDVVVFNDYTYNGRKNHHKSFGYLRTSELAKVVFSFLSEDKKDALQSFKAWINRFILLKQ